MAISIYEGNTGDAKTLPDQVKRLARGLRRLAPALVGDRGVISHKAIEALRSLDGLAWITALRSSQLSALVQEGALQIRLFDERDLIEFAQPDYPKERLMTCRSAHLGAPASAQARS